jgi:YD repeat-containing protein
MPTTSFTVHTSLSPSEVLGLLTDFGPERAQRWANIDDSHFQVHERGPEWAEVTEGNALGWERERYTWDAAAGVVEVETLDSNLWGPGSGWRYQLVPEAEGTDVQVTVTRTSRSLRGRLVGAVIPIGGPVLLGRQLRSVLRQAETR